MLLAVAGLAPDAVGELTKRLASGDWSSFSPAEQRAFRCAWQLSREPAGFSAGQRRALEQVLGRERAIDVIWQVAWANYMTRFADAFQLPLERDNVFAGPSGSG